MTRNLRFLVTINTSGSWPEIVSRLFPHRGRFSSMPHLHVLDDFIEEIRNKEPVLREGEDPPDSDYDLYCEKCQGHRRMTIHCLYLAPRIRQAWMSEFHELPLELVPSCFRLTCVQCKADSIAVIYEGPTGPTLAILRSTRGGMTSRHTPPAVSYYLDQAARAQNVGAFSAAVVMYRSALEQLLVQQGYSDGTCGTKIGKLLSDQKAGKAPKWVDQLHEDDLHVLNRLGNGAVHANGGDISKQEVLDAELYAAVTLTFEAVLDAAYERPKREAERRAKLAAAAAKMR
ncbi:DUF4145 domain-containing protein [Archangium lansingense]|uniref:DUF4145 domain-containing protein n=1 Tax=Archangium lansingense TaxID=2995310 RepID=A0ABT4AIE2_9BACT|nr:DUF4145 domain-containing protein [Archangium lansinium]MCY1081443.1 DUF4145 domain-containing protein [Archangium lansinium]